MCICLVLALLLLARIISSPVSGIIFAIALVLFGSFSRGFRKVKDSPDTAHIISSSSEKG